MRAHNAIRHVIIHHPLRCDRCSAEKDGAYALWLRYPNTNIKGKIMDMSVDLFAEQSYGKIALKKLAPTDENFRLFEAGYLGNDNQRDVLEVKGAVFRKALRGPNKGQLSIKVPDTTRAAYVTADEMRNFDGADGATKS